MKTGPWRLIFLGTPQFAVPSLAALLDAGEEVVAVITQPDRPRGRGQKVSLPPVKELAVSRGLTVLQPVRLKDPDFIARLKDLAPELMVVTAYGRILTHEMLALPREGFLNVHASLLPRHRGAAPINWALIRGDQETGVTIMWVTYEVDTGPIFLQEGVPIDPEDNAGTLAAKLSERGAALLVQALEQLRRGEGQKIPQPETGVTYAPPLTPEMRLIRWDQDAAQVANWIRGLDPRPGAYTLWQGQRLRLFGARVEKPGNRAAAPGTALGLVQGRLELACGQGTVGIKELQLAGHKRMPAEAFLRGQPLLGQVLGH
ncbi:MAG: methionyl-tRNA formyltransferase [Thermodesulfobacteriota bacterium]